MKRILTVSTNADIINTVKNACKLYPSYFEYDLLTDFEKVVNYIEYQIPEIKVIDFTSNDINSNEILSLINRDPWLHLGGIIAVCKDSNAVLELENKKNTNIVAILTIKNFVKHFSPHILFVLSDYFEVNLIFTFKNHPFVLSCLMIFKEMSKRYRN